MFAGCFVISNFSLMEPGIREFFKRLVMSISLLILWMAINLVIGIKYNYAFYDDSMHWYNIIFYIWLVLSFILLMWIYKKIWEKPIENLHDR